MLNTINDDEKMKAKVMEQTKLCNESFLKNEKKKGESKSDGGEEKIKP
jgi:hypothetical protein